jgi:hypothetical protein
MAVVVVLALVVLVFGGFSLIVWVGVFRVGHDQKVAESNAATILDETFDGRPDVTFNINMRSLKYETVIAGAKERGYELSHQAGDPNGAMTLIFEKHETAPSR